jgi:hypothetical protein
LPNVSGRIASMLRVGGALFAVAVIACAAHGAQAEVTRVEIASRTDVLGGKATSRRTGDYVLDKKKGLVPRVVLSAGAY